MRLFSTTSFIINRLIALSLIGSLANLVPELWPIQFWPLEVNRNLGAYYLGAHFFGILWLLGSFKLKPEWLTLRLKYLVLFLSFLLVIFYGRVLWPYYFKPAINNFDHQSAHARPISKTKQKIAALYANVLTSNSNYSNLIELINRYRPDIIGLIEVDQIWLSKLNLDANYPYNRAIPRTDNFGLALYSKYKIISSGQENIGDGLPPILDLTFELGAESKLRTILVHTLPPISQSALAKNNLLIRRITTPLRHRHENVIVLGDLNATPFSSYYQRFESAARLSATMWGHGYLKTWDASSNLFHFQLDHILYKGDMSSVRTEILNSFGSDHFPILAELEVE